MRKLAWFTSVSFLSLSLWVTYWMTYRNVVIARACKARIIENLDQYEREALQRIKTGVSDEPPLQYVSPDAVYAGCLREHGIHNFHFADSAQRESAVE